MKVDRCKVILELEVLASIWYSAAEEKKTPRDLYRHVVIKQHLTVTDLEPESLCLFVNRQHTILHVSDHYSSSLYDFVQQYEHINKHAYW